MENVLKERLEQLRLERDRGHRHLELVDRQRRELVDRLLRIEGAIQVIEELLPAAEAPAIEAPLSRI